MVDIAQAKESGRRDSDAAVLTQGENLTCTECHDIPQARRPSTSNKTLSQLASLAYPRPSHSSPTDVLTAMKTNLEIKRLDIESIPAEEMLNILDWTPIDEEKKCFSVRLYDEAKLETQSTDTYEKFRENLIKQGTKNLLALANKNKYLVYNLEFKLKVLADPNFAKLCYWSIAKFGLTKHDMPIEQMCSVCFEDELGHMGYFSALQTESFYDFVQKFKKDFGFNYKLDLYCLLDNYCTHHYLQAHESGDAKKIFVLLENIFNIKPKDSDDFWEVWNIFHELPFENYEKEIARLKQNIDKIGSIYGENFKPKSISQIAFYLRWNDDLEKTLSSDSASYYNFFKQRFSQLQTLNSLYELKDCFIEKYVEPLDKAGITPEGLTVLESLCNRLGIKFSELDFRESKGVFIDQKNLILLSEDKEFLSFIDNMIRDYPIIKQKKELSTLTKLIDCYKVKDQYLAYLSEVKKLNKYLSSPNALDNIGLDVSNLDLKITLVKELIEKIKKEERTYNNEDRSIHYNDFVFRTADLSYPDLPYTKNGLEQMFALVRSEDIRDFSFLRTVLKDISSRYELIGLLNYSKTEREEVIDRYSQLRNLLEKECGFTFWKADFFANHLTFFHEPSSTAKLISYIKENPSKHSFKSLYEFLVNNYPPSIDSLQNKKGTSDKTTYIEGNSRPLKETCFEIAMMCIDKNIYKAETLLKTLIDLGLDLRDSKKLDKVINFVLVQPAVQEALKEPEFISFYKELNSKYFANTKDVFIVPDIADFYLQTKKDPKLLQSLNSPKFSYARSYLLDRFHIAQLHPNIIATITYLAAYADFKELDKLIEKVKTSSPGEKVYPNDLTLLTAVLIKENTQLRAKLLNDNGEIDRLGLELYLSQYYKRHRDYVDPDRVKYYKDKLESETLSEPERYCYEKRLQEKIKIDEKLKTQGFSLCPKPKTLSTLALLRTRLIGEHLENTDLDPPAVLKDRQGLSQIIENGLGKLAYRDIEKERNSECGGIYVIENGRLKLKEVQSWSRDNNSYNSNNRWQNFFNGGVLSIHLHATEIKVESCAALPSGIFDNGGDMVNASYNNLTDIVGTTMGHPFGPDGKEQKDKILMDIKLFYKDKRDCKNQKDIVVALGVFTLPYKQ